MKNLKTVKNFLCLFLLFFGAHLIFAQTPDTALFNFENGELYGFYGGNNAPVLANDTSIAYAGSGSMKVTCNITGTNEVQMDAPGAVIAGTPIDIYIFVPADMTASFQPFILDGAWGWSSGWVDKSSIAKNTWTKVSLAVPQSAVLPINRLGIQIISDTVGSIWIDSINFVSAQVIDKSELDAAIVSAKSLFGQAIEGDAIGQYPPGSKAVFGAAIDLAVLVMNKADATQSEVDNALMNLATTQSVFESAKNAILPPKNLTLVITDEAALGLRWEASPNAGNYSVKRSTSFQGPYEVLASGLSVLSYTDTHAVIKTTYFYTVTASAGGVESDPAPVVYGKILGPSQLQDLPLFVKTIPGGWVGGDSDCIEAPGSLFPIDNAMSFNNLSSLRVNVTKNGSWWCGLLAGNSWCTYNLEDYYANGNLEFNIKGLEGGESFTLGFYDKVPERDPLERGADFPLPSLVNVTREWQHVSIPLKSLIDSMKCNLRSISYLRFNKDYGTPKQIFTVWVNDIKVTSTDSEKNYAAIKVNQLGYTGKAEKRAVVSCFDGVYNLSENTAFSVKNAVDGSVAYKGKLEKITNFDEIVSGEKIFVADFTRLTKPGSYYISVDAQSVPNSYGFKIGDSIYESLITAASRYFYLQRANIILSDTHAGAWAREDYTPSDFAAPLESDPSGPARDVSGGWYDAGDFGKYTNAGATAVSDLLWAYKIFPDQFTDNQFNIPESGNGIPDILDEAKVELDFLLKIQDTDGGFFHRVQGGTIKEDNKRYIMDTRNGQTLLKPTSHTAAAVGVLAHAATIYSKFDAVFADKLLKAAISGWGYLENHPELVTSLDGPYFDNNDKDDRLYAAGSLFHATKGKKYGDYFLAHYEEFTDYFDNPGTSHGVGDPTVTSFFLYNDTKGADREEYSWFKKKFDNWRSVQLARSFGNPWRNSLRYYDYYWGSNLPVLCTSMDLVIGSKMFGEYTGQVVNVARNNLNYVLGMNPMSFSYVSGFGDNSMKNTFSGIYSSDGKPGIPEGYIAGGANMYEGSWFSRFGGKCYNDINTEWTTNEHTIYWNSGLVFSAALANEESSKKAGIPVCAFPYPVTRVIDAGESSQIRVFAFSNDLRLLDLEGATFTYVSNRPEVASVDASGIVTGIKKGSATISIKVQYGPYELQTRAYIIVKNDLHKHK